MPESAGVTVIVLLGICLGLLLLVLALIFRIFLRLTHLESLLGRSSGRIESSDDVPSVAETSPGGAFEAFLDQDPARRDLPKSDQFKAYRKWRQENGMNWSAS